MDKKVLLVIPAYNEEANILNTYQKIQECCQKIQKNYDVIVINDGSTDQTENILMNNGIPHIHLIHNLGIGGAVQTGYKYAYQNNYDIAIQFDGDGQHDVNFVEKLIQPIISGEANMTIGSRFIDKTSSDFKSTKARQMGIKLISSFIHFCTKKKIYDVTSGFRAIDRNLIVRFSTDYPLEYPEPISTTEILKSGFNVKEVAVSMNERTGGVSSIHSWKNAYYMINVLLSIFIVAARGND